MYPKSLLSFALSASVLFVGLFAVVHAAPIEVRDVFVPPILYPHAGTVWKIGNHHNVTWSLNDEPVNITNGKGMVVLAKGGLMFESEPGGLNDPLASGFDIRLGRVEIQVPNVTPASDYQLVLFGDSGNISPSFTIEA